jgi:hypothetical protein
LFSRFFRGKDRVGEFSLFPKLDYRVFGWNKFSVGSGVTKNFFNGKILVRGAGWLVPGFWFIGTVRHTLINKGQNENLEQLDYEKN